MCKCLYVRLRDPVRLCVRSWAFWTRLMCVLSCSVGAWARRDRLKITKPSSSTDWPGGTPRWSLLNSGTAIGTTCARFQTRLKKLSPSKSSMFLELTQLASSRRAAPPTPSTPSTAPARSAALCHRLTRVLRSQATRLWPRQPPLSTSRAHDSLSTHYAHADTSRFALYDDCSSHVGRYR